MFTNSSIGVFDSGVGGISIYRSLKDALPNHDFVYFGDNARAPYGNRAFETILEYTWQGVQFLHGKGCDLIILACNTASARALRKIQQERLASMPSHVRVLGIVIPTAEVIDKYTTSQHVGILATKGTVLSNSYIIEINKRHPDIVVSQQACLMWASLIENNLHLTSGAEYFIKSDIESLLNKDPKIDALILACTHFPLLKPIIEKIVGNGIRVIDQGGLVVEAFLSYLKKHAHWENILTKTKSELFYTTDTNTHFKEIAQLFLDREIDVSHIEL